MDQGYINARVRGMYRTLLGPDALRALILLPDLDAMIAQFQKTPYREELETSCVWRSSVVCIENALRGRLAKTYSKILRMFGDDDAARYVRIFLNRWDVHNLKTILRGKNIHSPPEEIREALVPAGTLDEATLVELLKQNDVRESSTSSPRGGSTTPGPLRRTRRVEPVARAARDGARARPVLLRLRPGDGPGQADPRPWSSASSSAPRSTSPTSRP